MKNNREPVAKNITWEEIKEVDFIFNEKSKPSRKFVKIIELFEIIQAFFAGH